MASFLPKPRRRPIRVLVTMWTACATAIAMTMIGTPALVGLNTVSIQPANPMVVVIMNTTTAMMDTVPSTVRSSRAALTTMMKKHDRYEGLKIIPCGVGEGAVHDDIPGQVIGDVRMVRSGLVQQGIEIIGNLDHRGVWVFGQDEIDCHPAHASVMGDQTPGNVDGVQRDRLDARQVCIAERPRVLDERPDNQIVLPEPPRYGYSW